MSDPKRTPPFTPPGQQTNSFTHTQTPNSAARSVPRYPQYSDVWTRLNTFYNFPRNSNQSTRSLAEAGFFYNGKSDCVWCFFCGGPLSNWKSDDDPWIEHARWYPDCHYLQGRRGQQYIEMWNQPQPGESTNGLRELPDRYRDNATQNQLSRTDQPQSRHHSFEVLRPPTSHSLQTGAISDAYERGPRPHHQNTYSQRQFPQRYTPEGKSQVAVKLNNTHTRKHERSGTRNLALSAPKPSAREDSRIRPIRDKTDDGHFSVISKMKKNGLDEQTIQKAIHLLQRTHGSADIDANEVINLILDHAARACFEQQSRVDGLPSLETEASVLENDGSPSIVQITCSAQQVQSLDDDRESLIVPSHCSAHVQIDPTRRRCGNYDTPQRITTLGDTCSNNGEHQSEEGNTVLDYDNISSEPPGAMASSQLSEVDDNSDDSHDIHESPAILSVRSMGYSDQSIQPALQRLQNRNSEVTGGTLMAEIIQFEDPDPIVEEYCRMKDSLTCKVCLMNTVSIALLPCGHLLCLECAKNSSIRSCHICRSPKNKTQNIFFV